MIVVLVGTLAKRLGAHVTFVVVVFIHAFAEYLATVVTEVISVVVCADYVRIACAVWDKPGD